MDITARLALTLDNALVPWILWAAGRGAVVLGVAALATLAMRHRSAASRHLVWSVAIVSVLALPLLTIALPSWRMPLVRAIPGAAPQSVPSSVPAKRQSIPARDHAAVPAPGPELTEIRAAQSAVSFPVTPSAAAPSLTLVDVARWLPLVWLSGAMLVLLRLVVGWIGVRRLARQARPIAERQWWTLLEATRRELGIHREVRLLSSRRTGIPVTWGLVRPVILLPADADRWPVERRRLVLLHELAHVWRFDTLTQLLAHLCLAVFWIDPLVWLAVRRMRVERERACDDCVLAHGTRASGYARELLDIARSLGSGESPAFAALAMARASEFEGRLLAILDPRRSRRPLGRAGHVSVAGAAMVLVFPLASIQPSAPVAARARATPAASSGMHMDAAPGPLVAPPVERREPHDSSLRARISRVHPVDGTLEGATVVTIQRPTIAITAMVEATPATDDPRPTLIAVARSAARMSSDYEKASLLIEIVERKLADDAVNTAILEAAKTLQSDNEHQRLLTALIGAGTLSTPTLVALLDDAARISSDFSRSQVLLLVVGRYAFDDADVRRALIRAATTIGSDVNKAQVLTAAVGRSPLSTESVTALIRAAATIGSSTQKSAVLMAAAPRIAPDDSTARSALIAAAESLGSDTAYRRVMTALVRK